MRFRAYAVVLLKKVIPVIVGLAVLVGVIIVLAGVFDEKIQPGRTAVSAPEESTEAPDTYEVREIIIVQPTELWVTEPREGAWLTLTTCHPKFSARQRLIVFAELVDGPNWEAIYA